MLKDKVLRASLVAVSKKPSRDEGKVREKSRRIKVKF